MSLGTLALELAIYSSNFAPLYFFCFDFLSWVSRLGNDDTHFEVSMAKDGCEVHRFDPSVKSAHVLESRRLWHHRLAIDWRDPHPAVAAQKLHSNTRKLGSILNEFGHHKVRLLV